VIYDLFQIRGIQGRPYHPETRGQVERKNRTLKTALFILF